MVKVILWSDKSDYPSLPLMKISAYHKGLGDDVKLYEFGLDSGDILYKSKAFSFTDDLMYYPEVSEVIQGGSGYAIGIEDGREVYNRNLDLPLPNVIEGQYPDYQLFSGLKKFKDTAFGFLTRGCCNDCSFCIVSKKEGLCSRQMANLSDFWRGQRYIKLMDGNLLACKDREKLIQQLIDSGAWVDFTQGLDARFMTDDIAKLICKVKIKIAHFAFDSLKDEARIIKGLEIFQRYFKARDKECRVYILTNYDTTREDDLYRVHKVLELGCNPYIMIYRKGTHDRFLTDLARWCNCPFLNKKCSLRAYVPRVDGRSFGELYGVDMEKLTQMARGEGIDPSVKEGLK